MFLFTQLAHARSTGDNTMNEVGVYRTAIGLLSTINLGKTPPVMVSP